MTSTCTALFWRSDFGDGGAQCPSTEGALGSQIAPGSYALPKVPLVTLELLAPLVVREVVVHGMVVLDPCAGLIEGAIDGGAFESIVGFTPDSRGSIYYVRIDLDGGTRLDQLRLSRGIDGGSEGFALDQLSAFE